MTFGGVLAVSDKRYRQKANQKVAQAVDGPADNQLKSAT